MNKLDSQSASLTFSPNPKPGHRLIVLVPHLEADPAVATRRVWELANATNAGVQFIGLYSDAAQEPGLRRQLVIMSAMVKDGRVFAETETVFGKDWLEVVRSRRQAGDVVVCFAGHCVGPLNRSLSDVLQSNLDVPVYILSGLYPQKNPRFNWQTQIFTWGGTIAIILGFFLLQVQIDHLAKGWTHIVLLLLSIPVEVWILWVWNSLFR